MRKTPIIASTVAATLLVVSALWADPYFATHVEKYEPLRPGFYLDDPYYNNPEVAVGAPIGISEYEPDNTSVVTLGDGGRITLSFDHNVEDDPKNPGGYDFIVFSNVFMSLNPVGYRSQEPAFVEISTNGTDWYLLPPNKLPSQLTRSDVSQSMTVLRNYAEYTPTLGLPLNRTNEEFYTIPDRQSFAGDAESLKIDPTSGGGDAFDIATAVREVSPGVPMYDALGKTIPAGITSFKYIRMTDAVKGDVWMGAEVSAEIDAVADVRPAVTIGEAKKLSTGDFALICGAKVTATTSDGFWIEQQDRSAGIRVVSNIKASIGNTVEITGHIAEQGEKFITDALVTILDSKTIDPVKPIGLANKAAQLEMPRGLLVKVWGKRKATGSGWFTIDDGSGCPIKVLCEPTAVVPGSEVMTCVTGVLTRDVTGAPAVQTRTASDIKF